MLQDTLFAFFAYIQDLGAWGSVILCFVYALCTVFFVPVTVQFVSLFCSSPVVLGAQFGSGLLLWFVARLCVCIVWRRDRGISCFSARSPLPEGLGKWSNDSNG